MEKKKYKYVHEFECTTCSTKHLVRVGNMSSAITNKKTNFCSLDCRKAWYALKRKYKSCEKCGQDFRYNESTDNKSFCSPKCYHQDLKDNPEKYDLFNKMKYAQSYSNNEVTIQKMKETKLANGTMIDWKDAQWKQFWRKCNDLTRKVRSLKIEEWDGVDYIDGEYIKDNLSLPFKDINYPCLDHIKPKWICYQEGLTPYECCDIKNLAWTKRTNNSKKGIKYNERSNY